jgi:hypothetical protein
METSDKGCSEFALLFKTILNVEDVAGIVGMIDFIDNA